MYTPKNFISGKGIDIQNNIAQRKIGIIQKNSDIRDEILRKNIGKYPMSEGYTANIGKIANAYSILNNKPSQMDNKGLLFKTHDDNEFGKQINQKYGLDANTMEYYVGRVVPNIIQKWNGNFQKSSNNKLDKDYDNYLDYMSYVFGNEVTLNNYLAEIFQADKISSALGKEFKPSDILTVREVLNSFLSYGDLKSAMEFNNVGVVRNLNVLAALGGYVNTNINNFSGTDSKLGLITNTMYANTLRDSAQFNSLRGSKAITPSLRGIYGNTLSNLANLPFLTTINELTGRIENEVGRGEGVRHIYDTHDFMFPTMSDFADSTNYPKYKEIYDSNTARYANILRNYEKGLYTPFKTYLNNSLSFETTGSHVSNVISSLYYKLWSDKSDISDDVPTIISEIDGSTYRNISNDRISPKSIVSKTQKLFKEKNNKGIDTIIGGFHTTGYRDNTHNQVSVIQSAVTKFGMSHGRNLLNSKAYITGISDNVNSYENPYDRVWTYHKPFSTVKDLMKSNTEGIWEQQKNWSNFNRTIDGPEHLGQNTVLNKNGFVNITPTNEGMDSIDIKNCMFSIENLAWKDVKKTENVIKVDKDGEEENDSLVLSKEQIGPMGGRIMWFPPYNIRFNEQVSVGWNANEFIGRGEKIYTYTNTERQGTLSFSLLIDYPSIVNYWSRGKNTNSANKEDYEQELLRFFAGCDTLKVDNYEEEWLNRKPKEEKPIKRNEIKIGNPGAKKIVFYTFFPNNCSYGLWESKEFNIGMSILDVNGNFKLFTKEELAPAYLYQGENWTISNGTGPGYEMSDRPITVGENEGYKGQGWMYMVDNNIIKANQKPYNKESYKDKQSLKLNSDINAVKKDDNFKDATNTFKEIYEKLDEVIGKNYRAKKITIRGFASSQGNDDNNHLLSRKRGQVIADWLKKRLKLENNAFVIEEPSILDVDAQDINDISGESAKRARCVKIEIECELDVLVSNSKTEDSKYTLDIEPEVLSKKAQRTAKKELRKLKRSKEYKKSFKEAAKLNENLRLEINQDMAQKIKEDNRDVLNTAIRKSLLDNKPKEISAKIERIKPKKTRYDNESEFFKMLKENDPFMHKKIVDKIQYFDPAYHSVTPEGFNARLTFLQQCTRQGHTIGASDGLWSTKSAGNLAFGKPPVCVLRLGDFYHTKVIFNNLTIEYEPMVWDMNPEGIGMQPMIANISMNFTFLGGSDLEAPISRLQNAVSFNYYANSSVYDDRADMGQYVDNDNVIKGKVWKVVPTTKNDEQNK